MPISGHRSAFFVACILMHDRFYAAHDVAHGFIEYPAVRGLTQCNSERHSPYQRFFILCNKLHATGLHEIKCGGFFWRLKRCCMVACILMHDEFPTAQQCRPRIY